MRPVKAFLWPARAFSIVENVAKARPRISNCRSRISSILQRNLYIEKKWTFTARGKYMLIIWPFELWVVQAWPRDCTSSDIYISNTNNCRTLYCKLKHQPNLFVGDIINFQLKKCIHINWTTISRAFSSSQIFSYWIGRSISFLIVTFPYCR